ncbi:MAG: HNH endonuclease, partial [Chitinophagaceae bacterium]|nr:HNH endonuclease [Anaerolineae bacterium]
KLSNFVSLDPYHKARGIKGLANASKMDKAVWEEARSDWNSFGEESEQLLAEISGEEIDAVSPQVALELITKPTEAERSVKIRLGQQFFRKTVLADYGYCCCICGMPLHKLLIASLLGPWRDREDLRLNPHNGLCLCALHDKAFDSGYLSIDEEYRTLINPIIDQYLPNAAINSNFKVYAGLKIQLPEKFWPDIKFIALHNQSYFS